MGQNQSKNEQLFQHVYDGNSEGIKSLCSQGARLEHVDRQGQTPLIVACMKPELHDAAKTLIELGANVNAYCPGRHGGTPLHHAARRGLEKTVDLLLLHGANALVINDDSHTPLDIARAKGYGKIVHKIESQICLFSGWLRELYVPRFLEVLTPQLLSRKVWVVVLPCGSRNLQKPLKLELAIYARSQDAQPRTTVALWKANMEGPVFAQPVPAVFISEASTISRHRRRRRCTARGLRQTRIKLTSVNEGDKQQLLQFYGACKGIPQAVHPSFPFNTPTTAVQATAPPAVEDVELAMAINASIQSAMEEAINNPQPTPRTGAPIDVDNSSGFTDHSTFGVPGAPTVEASCCQWLKQAPGTSGASTLTSMGTHAPTVVPSAPTTVNEAMDTGPIHYPHIDSGTTGTSALEVENSHTARDRMQSGGSCVICLDAPVESVCIPCGHMAGCMSCLSEVKAKKWGCPICRGKINQVVRVYAV
ncbi:hypothetical protein Nepgr_020706 [Nepenthes gracilis]|uniref:RING-type domain-containing protein n=1 Tax=Nepenthes gracilis TaxID=150966 RepID=A0AAD3SXB9_NEPGR|nr:hypothetical protein Nepgr_020706 [Nepenthes gracilis]